MDCGGRTRRREAVKSDGLFPRYQGKTCDGTSPSGRTCANLGGTAEVIRLLSQRSIPYWSFRGQGSFFLARKGPGRKELTPWQTKTFPTRSTCPRTKCRARGTIKTDEAGTLDFSGVPAFFVTIVLLVQCSTAYNVHRFEPLFHQFHSGFQFVQSLMIIDPVSRVFGHMTHEKINTLPVCPGAVQLTFKGVAAFMRGVVHPKGLHNIRPKNTVLGLRTSPSVIADQAGATFSKTGFNQWPDLGMNRNQPIFTGLGFGSALHRPGLKVNIFRLQIQKFTDPPPGIYQDQDGINPRLFLMRPNLFDFILAEWKAAGWWNWIRSEKIRKAPVDYIHFQSEPVKMAPKVLDCRLGAISLPAPVNGFLHLVGSNLFIGLFPQR